VNVTPFSTTNVILNVFYSTGVSGGAVIVEFFSTVAGAFQDSDFNVTVTDDR